MDIRVGLERVASSSEVAAEWTDLEARSDASFFQSWGWIGTWLDVIALRFGVLRLRATRGDQTVGLGLLVSRRGRLGGQALHLHETGRDTIDQLNTEHNGFLVARDHAVETRAACLDFVSRLLRDGGRAVFGGVSPDYVDGAGLQTFVRRREPSFVVDLGAVRAHGDYTALLGHRTRKNMRRSRRFYERWGPMTFEPAEDPAGADSYLEEMSELHERVWSARGFHGSFANPVYVRFHRELIRRRLPAGEIQLARVRAGDRQVGYLYNFVYRDRVYAYQAGLRYEQHPAYQPGRMCDWLAIEHAARAGLNVYDFLAGDTQYKRSLGTRCEERAWIVASRNGASFASERTGKAVRELARSIRVRLPRPARRVAESVVSLARSRSARR